MKLLFDGTDYMSPNLAAGGHGRHIVDVPYTSREKYRDVPFTSVGAGKAERAQRGSGRRQGGRQRRTSDERGGVGEVKDLVCGGQRHSPGPHDWPGGPCEHSAASVVAGDTEGTRREQCCGVTKLGKHGVVTSAGGGERGPKLKEGRRHLAA